MEQKVFIEEDGQLALPPEWCKRHGVKRGNFVFIEETEDGRLVIVPRDVRVSELLTEIGDALKEKGITLEQLLEDSEQIRQEIYEENYGHAEIAHNQM